MEIIEKINFIAVHHSQNKLDLESIKKLHVDEYLWEDIGYHWIIDKKGNLLKGRSENFAGAHILGHNKNSIGVCLIGNFDEEKPTKKQIEALIEFLKEKIKGHGISVKNILGHREFPNVKKSCPGKFVDMNELRNLVKKY